MPRRDAISGRRDGRRHVDRIERASVGDRARSYGRWSALGPKRMTLVAAVEQAHAQGASYREVAVSLSVEFHAERVGAA